MSRRAVAVVALLASACASGPRPEPPRVLRRLMAERRGRVEIAKGYARVSR